MTAGSLARDPKIHARSSHVRKGATQASNEGWLTGFEPAISRSTIGPDQPAEQTPNPYTISILASRMSFARDLIPSRVIAGNRGIPGAKTVENGRQSYGCQSSDRAVTRLSDFA